MSSSHPLDKTVIGEFPPIRDLKDIEAFESIPLSERLAASNTYEAICNGAAVNPQAPAIHFLQTGEMDEEPITFSYAQLLGRINQAANLFHELGVGKDDVVSYLLPLVPQAYFVLFGGQIAGIVNAVNPMLEAGQIVEILRAAGTKVLVSLGPMPGVEIWEKTLEVRKSLPNLKTILQVMGPGDEENGIYSYDTLAERQPADQLISDRIIATEDIVSYFHTGGTTGTPKLAQHTHANQVFMAWCVGSMLGMAPGQTFLAGLPMFHVTGAVGALSNFSSGNTIVVMTPAGFRNPAVVRNYWRLVERYRATTIFGVPTIISALLDVPVDGADLSSVRYTVTGASTVPVKVAQAMQEKTGKPVVEIYGLTEATGLTNSAPRDGDIRIGAAGLRCPYTDVKTVEMDADENYVRDCDVDEIGVVAIQGPHVFPGYVQDSYNEKIFFGDGWLNTGDLGRIDKDGHLWITGRAKDIIIRGGHNIDPAVIEEALHEHPAVELAAAVGRPDGHAGELPVAYVQLRAGQQAERAELMEFARERIPERAANPVDLFVLDVIPLTLVGKIFKPELRWDATRRVYLEALAPIAESGVGVGVSVAADKVHGSMATITLSGSGERQAVEGQVASILDPFGVAHQITWD